MNRPIARYLPMTRVRSTISAGVKCSPSRAEEIVVDVLRVGAESLGVLDGDPLGVVEQVAVGVTRHRRQ